ncbi:phage baseplate plug protein [Pantoea sp. S18]|uniref:phage baseplate plug family protein n=1 Tax=Pantoea sp. S18 TaxID=3019892 RepID=UPI002B1F4372|nr:hypothetical protein [Pantoea sp. S18]MEA5104677.1 hypothetical protein [Pantoea sp. S18]
MTISEIPLQPQNQTFTTTIAGTIYKMTVVWRDSCWFLDIYSADSVMLIGGIPLVTGSDLLSQFSYLGLGFSLFVVCDTDGQDYPTQDDLGIASHLMVYVE